MTYAEAVAAAKRDYLAFLGRVFRPKNEALCYLNDQSTTEEVIVNGEVSVRLIETDDESLAHDTGGYVDPYWELEIVADPQNLMGGRRYCYMIGPPHQYTGE